MRSYPRFISFEGIDYSGKTTQLQRLVERMTALQLDFELLREPGGTAISEKIRDILLDNDHRELHPRTEILLFSAARSQLVQEKLLPLLNAGKYVVADRFFDSTTVYQGFGRKLNISFVRRLNQFATAGLLPYRTFLIDITPETALKRLTQSGRTSDRLDSESLEFYHAIYQAYHHLANQYPDRFVVINGEADADDITADIWNRILVLWKL